MFIWKKMKKGSSVGRFLILGRPYPPIPPLYVPLPCLQSTELLSKQFLLLPLVDAEHASLLIVCQPPAGAGGIVAEQGRCILHLDSGGWPQLAASVGMCLAAGKALKGCWCRPA
jgi:hypothetical protein